MTILRIDYRPKRTPRKRKKPAIVSRIVTPAKLKPLKGPVIRLGANWSDDTTNKPQRRSAIVEPKRRPQTSIFGAAPDMTAEEHRRRGDGAAEVFREVVRRAKGDD